MSESGNWSLIESDPGVFTEIIKGFGVEGLECEEVYDLYEVSNVSDAYGFIFLFNYDNKSDNIGKVIFDDKASGIFFAKQLFEFDDKAQKSKEDVYHFVSYLPINGILYELDGLKPGAIDHGKIPDDVSWIDFIRPILTKRMDKCVDGKFNILAVVPNKLKMYEQQLAELTSKQENPPTSCISDLKSNIQWEKRKAALYRAENIRRRHNYLPLIVELLKILAEDKRLVRAVEKIKTLIHERNNALIAAKKVKFL